MTKPSEAKQALRRAAADRRASLGAAAGRGDDSGERAAERLFRSIEIASGDVVSAYWPVRDELDSRPLLDRLYAAGAQAALPVVTRRGAALAFRAWTPAVRLVSGNFAIPVPPADSPTLRPAVLVVPLLAFDRQGYRLGYGGGYYDRTLAALRAETGAALAVGYGFAAQEVAAVPRGPNDQRLDWIVTEEEAWKVSE